MGTQMVRMEIKKSMGKLYRYDPSVQFIRIIACMMVIGCHIRLYPAGGGIVDKSLLLIHCCLDDGVAIFFIIAGFFMFTGKRICSVYASAVHGIFLPVLAVSFISMLLRDWVYGDRGLMECLLLPSVDIVLLCKAILHCDATIVPLCSHFWYIVRYLQIILLYPALRLLCEKDNKQAQTGCICLVCILMFNQLVSDINAYTGSAIGTVSTIPVPVALVLLGFLIYTYKDCIQKNTICRVLSALTLISITGIRYVLQYNLLVSSGDTYFYYWDTFCGIVFAVSFILFIMTFRIENNVAKLIINYIGSQTFFIYMIHVLVYEKLSQLGFRDWLYAKTISSTEESTFIGEAGFTIGYILSTFVIGLLIGTFIKCITAGAKILKSAVKTHHSL